MLRTVQPNHWKPAVLLGACSLGLLAFVTVGDIRHVSGWQWLELIGEGSSALLALAWLFRVTKTHAAGRVTDYLTVGLSCVCFSAWIDTLDDVIRLPDEVYWDNWLESGLMPVGLLLLSIGLHLWRREQAAHHTRMEKREREVREQRLYNRLIPPGSPEYLQRQLVLHLEKRVTEQQPLSLLVVDINDFDTLNTTHGRAEGDDILESLGQLLTLNLRRDDVLCRLADDRFVVVLPGTGETQAREMALELQQAVAHLAYKTRQQGERLQLSASVGAVVAINETPENLLRRLNLSLARSRCPLSHTA